MKLHRLISVAGMLLLGLSLGAGLEAGEKTLWKPVAFAIFKFNGEAPKSWNLYHTEKRGHLQGWSRPGTANPAETRRQARLLNPPFKVPVSRFRLLVSGS
jgi:hypothetical protein